MSAPSPESNPPATENHVHPVLRQLAESICEDRRDRLPDLSDTVVLMPQLRPAVALNRALVDQARRHGYDALLLPRVRELKTFVAEQAPAAPGRLISDPERRLLLVTALRRHRNLFGRGSPWLLADNLLQLFDELSGFHVRLPDTPEAFAQSLAEAYRLPAEHPALMREAQLVQTLWQAWREQLEAENRIDPVLGYLQQLNDSLARLPAGTPLYAVGFDRCLPAERQWLETAAGKAGLAWFDSAAAVAAEPDQSGLLRSRVQPAQTPYTAFLDACYNTHAAPLYERIGAFRAQQPVSPARGRLHILGVNQLEQHAQTVALYVRAALAEGDRRVGVVSEDRRLARRIRALLERSGIALQDTVGWALSTTAAAATLENWLECVEQDFPHRAFLDLLKSPFYATPDTEAALKQIHRFEHDIVIHENIGSGIDRYRHAIHSRAGRLRWGQPLRRALLELLSRFERAARPLRRRHGRVTDAARLLELTLDSLRALQIEAPLGRDAAGEQLLATLQQLHEAARHQPVTVEWSEFRSWLSGALEHAYFRPPGAGGNTVQLLNLQQTDLLTFDVAVIAAADEQHFPGDPGRLPFFNDAVRRSLGLPDWRLRLRDRERLFRELLESSDTTLITWQQEHNGEPVAASPWVAALADFHRQAYGDALEPAALQQWLNRSELVPVIRDETVHAEMPGRPAPSPPAGRVPERLTASAHQRLIDCPYRFYVYDVLQLKALDEVREALQKSDYGNRVHECLEAFHFGREGRPGPFGEPLSTENRGRALELLETLSREVFAEDTENNFQHRGWLQRWLRFMPDYIDWQIGRAAYWQAHAGEQKTEASVDSGLVLHGRIDRVDRHDNTLSLIDYKTGALPKPAAVRAAEEVQLISYSLLMEHVESVLYLGLDGREGVNDRTQISGDELATLRSEVRDRLIDLMNRIRQGAPMPAIGDEATCRHCDAAGICRRKAWQPF